MSNKITFIIFVLTSILFLLCLLFFIESGYPTENFAGLQSQALLTLTTTNVVKEQELAANIVATAKAEITDAQEDLEKKKIIEATASEQLFKANSELVARKKNLSDIQTTLGKIFPPAAAPAAT